MMHRVAVIVSVSPAVVTAMDFGPFSIKQQVRSAAQLFTQKKPSSERDDSPSSDGLDGLKKLLNPLNLLTRSDGDYESDPPAGQERSDYSHTPTDRPRPVEAIYDGQYSQPHIRSDVAFYDSLRTPATNSYDAYSTEQSRHSRSGSYHTDDFPQRPPASGPPRFDAKKTYSRTHRPPLHYERSQDHSSAHQYASSDPRRYYSHSDSVGPYTDASRSSFSKNDHIHKPSRYDYEDGSRKQNPFNDGSRKQNPFNDQSRSGSSASPHRSDYRQPNSYYRSPDYHNADYRRSDYRVDVPKRDAVQRPLPGRYPEPPRPVVGREPAGKPTFSTRPGSGESRAYSIEMDTGGVGGSSDTQLFSTDGEDASLADRSDPPVAKAADTTAEESDPLAERFVASPPNDLCSNARILPSEFGLVEYDNKNAGLDGPPHEKCNPASVGLPDEHRQVDGDVWFCWSPPITGVVRISNCDSLSSQDTRLVVYEGCECQTEALNRNVLECSDDSCELQSSLDFTAQAEQKYLIRAGNTPGSPRASSSVFSITSVAPPVESGQNFDSHAADFDVTITTTDVEVTPPSPSPQRPTKTNDPIHTQGPDKKATSFEQFRPPQIPQDTPLPAKDGVDGDSCEVPIRIRGVGSFDFSTVGATSSVIELPLCQERADEITRLSKDIWLCWTAEHSEDPLSVVFHTCGGGPWDTAIQAFAGCDKCPTREEASLCSDDACGKQSGLRIDELAEGDQILLRIGSPSNDSGAGVLEVKIVG